MVGTSGSAGGILRFPSVPIPAPWFLVLQNDHYRPSASATACAPSPTSQTTTWVVWGIWKCFGSLPDFSRAIGCPAVPTGSGWYSWRQKDRMAHARRETPAVREMSGGAGRLTGRAGGISGWLQQLSSAGWHWAPWGFPHPGSVASPGKTHCTSALFAVALAGLHFSPPGSALGSGDTPCPLLQMTPP